jgi:hypothetical protein
MRPQKITLGEMRDMGVRGVVIYCADYHCSHSVALSADRWPDELNQRVSGSSPGAPTIQSTETRLGRPGCGKAYFPIVRAALARKK